MSKLTDYLKDSLLYNANSAVAKLTVFRNLREWVDQQVLTQNGRLYALEQNRDVSELLEHIRNTFKPVVLFRGLMLHGGERLGEVAWAHRAYEGSEGGAKSWSIDFQPNTNIVIQSIEVLNGPYFVTKCQIANHDITPYWNAVIPPQTVVAVPEKIGAISPANRVFVTLRGA